MSTNEYINLDVRELRIPYNGKELTISSEDSSNIIGACVLVFKAKGYNTYDEAFVAACDLRDCLSLAFLDIGIGADLVDRGPEGHTTEEGKEWVRKQFGIDEKTELRDNANLDIYEETFEVKHLSIGAKVEKLHNGEAFIDKIEAYVNKGKRLNKKEASAFNLFSLSKMQQNEVMIKFLLNFMAIESLIKRELRADAVVEDIKKALRTIEEDISYGEESKKAIKASLENAMQETINQAFSRLLRPVVSVSLKDLEDVEALIKELSKVRNKIAHEGRIPCSQKRIAELVEVLTQLLKQLILSDGVVE